MTEPVNDERGKGARPKQLVWIKILPHHVANITGRGGC